MRSLTAYHVVGLLWCCVALSANAQQIKVMQWNVHGNLGTTADNSTAAAAAIARIVNYNQPDVLLFNEVEEQTVSANTAALTAWVTNNLPYMGTQPGVTFFVAVSSVTDTFNRNCAISRYPFLSTGTYSDADMIRGLHSLKVQLTGTNALQIFHAHFKCCNASSECTERQANAQFASDTIRGWATTNSIPYIFAGDWNEDEAGPPQCTLTATYHPITTVRTNGNLVEFKPVALNGDSDTIGTPSPNNRFDYCLAGTNRLSALSGYVFNSVVWAQFGQYTNASPQNLASDSTTASDHVAVFVSYLFPTTSPNFTVTPTSAFISTGNQGGPFTSNYVYSLNNTNTTSLSWGVGKNASWLTLSATSGTLGANLSTNITVSVNSGADALAAGNYLDTITFSNATTGASVGRSVNLTVLASPRLVVSPTGALSSSGPVGGPFNPASFSYTLSNTGSSSLNWTANKSASWLTLSATAGSLAAGASTPVSALTNANTSALAAGAYGDTLGFTNTTNGNGNTNRAVNLTVGIGFFDDFSTFASGNLVGQNSWAQLASVSTLPLQVTAGKVVIPFGQSADNQDAYKNFTETSNTIFYGLTVTVSNAANDSTPSYFAAMTFSNNGAGFANYRLAARAPNAANTNFLFGARITAEVTNSFGAGLTYGTQYRVIVEADSGGTTMKVFVNPDSTNLAAQTAYLIKDIGTGTPPPQVGSFVISQFGSASVPNAGVSVGKVVVADNFPDAYNAITPAPAALVVTPATGLDIAGEQGGPFTPSAQTYALTNTGGSALNWSASVSNNWLSLSATSGALGAGIGTNVTVSTNINVNALVGGLYTNLVGFVNATNGTGNTNAAWSVLVRDGISDAWRFLYFGHVEPDASDMSRAQDDADGDGFNNLQEQAAGSDPTDSTSSLRIISVATESNDVRVTWMTGDDKTNALQTTSGNPGGGYVTNGFANLFIVTNTVGPVTNYVDVGAATNVPARYYRVRLLP